MKKLLFLFLFLVGFVQNGFSQNELWRKTSEERVLLLEKMDRNSFPSKYTLYNLDLQSLQNKLQDAPLDLTSSRSDLILPFPNSLIPKI